MIEDVVVVVVVAAGGNESEGRELSHVLLAVERLTLLLPLHGKEDECQRLFWSVAKLTA